MKTTKKLATEKLFSNLKKIVSVNTDITKNKICITYFVKENKNTKVKTDHIIISKNAINFDEMAHFVDNCIPNLNVFEMTLNDVKKLKQEILLGYLEN